MLALLIKVVREMVFTLGKWSFSKKPGKFTSYYTQGSNQRLGQQVQRLNSQHTCHWGAARGLFTESAARLTPGLDRELHQPCLCQTQGEPERKGSLVGREVKHWAETVETLWHLLKRHMWWVTTITNFEQCEWLFWTFSSVALSNMKPMIYELDSFI